MIRAAATLLTAALAAAPALRAGADEPDPRFAGVTLAAADACVARFRAYEEQAGLDCFRPLVAICPRTLSPEAGPGAALDCVTAEAAAWESVIDDHGREIAALGDRALVERFAAIQAQGRERLAQRCREAGDDTLGKAACHAAQLPDLFVALRLDHLAMLDARGRE